MTNKIITSWLININHKWSEEINPTGLCCKKKKLWKRSNNNVQVKPSCVPWYRTSLCIPFVLSIFPALWALFPVPLSHSECCSWSFGRKSTISAARHNHNFLRFTFYLVSLADGWPGLCRSCWYSLVRLARIPATFCLILYTIRAGYNDEINLQTECKNC